MTGYGERKFDSEDWLIEVEIKAVNSRYLDTRIKLPRSLSFAELDMKNWINEKIHRGRVEVNVSFLSYKKEVSYHIQKDLLHSLVEEFRKDYSLYSIPFDSFMRLEGMIFSKQENLSQESLLSDLRTCFQEALEEFLQSREIEGKALQENMLNKVENLELELSKIEERAPLYVQEEMKRLKRNVCLLLEDQSMDKNTLATELALFAQRADIDEELVRLKTHYKSFKEKLQEDGPVGKMLDFIIQEMNREMNTISSKSNDQALTSFCLEGKNKIEQLREQVQNIE